MEHVVSVIIPSHKRDLATVRRAVESVVNQTYKNIEIVVVDDSPADFEDRNAIADYVNSIDFEGTAVYIRNENPLGGSLARNVGIEACTGDYVTFLDDDDEYYPKKIENQLGFMLENNCDLSFSDMIIYNTAGKVVDYRDHPGIADFSNDTLLRYHLTKNLSGTPSFMFKTEKLREIGGFPDAKMGQDFYVMLRAIECGLDIKYCKTCDIKVYKHSNGGISQGRNKLSGENSLFEYKKKYFPRLTKSEIRFVKFRHYAVMVVAYLRNKNPLFALGMGVMAFVSSPADFFREVFGFFSRVIAHRDESYPEPEVEIKIPETVNK